MRRIWAIGFLAVWAAVGFAGERAAPIVEARSLLETDSAYPGGTVRAAVVATIAPGYHINEHKPSHNYLIATELKIDSNPQVTAHDIDYPRGKAIKFDFDDAKLSVYEGTIVVGAELKIAAKTQPGNYNLTGKFAYQACNDRACFPPTSVPVQLMVKVVRAGVPLKHVNQEIFKRVKFE